MPEIEPIENCAVSVQQFVEADGLMTYQIKQRGDAPTSTVIGLLVMAAITVYERNERNHE
jgi:hypothetical protein